MPILCQYGSSQPIKSEVLKIRKYSAHADGRERLSWYSWPDLSVAVKQYPIIFQRKSRRTVRNFTPPFMEACWSRMGVQKQWDSSISNSAGEINCGEWKSCRWCFSGSMAAASHCFLGNRQIWHEGWIEWLSVGESVKRPADLDIIGDIPLLHSCRPHQRGIWERAGLSSRVPSEALAGLWQNMSRNDSLRTLSAADKWSGKFHGEVPSFWYTVNWQCHYE